MSVTDPTRVNQIVDPTATTWSKLCRFVAGLLVDGGLNVTGGISHDGIAPTTDPGTVVTVAGLSVATVGDGVFNKTTLTLASMIMAITHDTTAGWGTQKLYDFPVGRILFLGVMSSIGVVVTDEAGMAQAGSGDFSVGSTGTADLTIDGTDVDLGPSVAMTDPFVLGVGAATATALAASTHFDGTTTAKDLFLNAIFDAGDVTADFDALLSGTVEVTWVNLGDV